MKLSALYVFLLYLVLFITGCNQVASVEDDTQEDSTSKQKTSDLATVHIDTVYHTDTIFNIGVKPIVHIDTAFQTDTSFNIKSDSTTRFDSAHTSYIDTIHIIKDVYDTIISQHIDTLYLDSTVTDTISRDSSLTDTISKPFIKVDTIHIIDSIPILDTIIQ